MQPTLNHLPTNIPRSLIFRGNTFTQVIKFNPSVPAGVTVKMTADNRIDSPQIVNATLTQMDAQTVHVVIDKADTDDLPLFFWSSYSWAGKVRMGGQMQSTLGLVDGQINQINVALKDGDVLSVNIVGLDVLEEVKLIAQQAKENQFTWRDTWTATPNPLYSKGDAVEYDGNSYYRKVDQAGEEATFIAERWSKMTQGGTVANKTIGLPKLADDVAIELSKVKNFFETVFNPLGLIKGWTDRKGKVMFGFTAKGEIVNPDYEATKTLLYNTNQLAQQAKTSADIASSKWTSYVDSVLNALGLAKGWTDRKGNVLFGFKSNGEIVNPDFQATKAIAQQAKTTADSLSTRVDTATTKADAAKTTADTAKASADVATAKTVNLVESVLNSEKLAKAWTDRKGNVLFGFKQNGDIVNPQFKKLWEAVFGGATSTGDLSDADTKIIFSNHLFTVEGRDFHLYGPSMLPTRNKNNDSYTFAIQSINSVNVPLQSVFQNGTRLNGSWLGSTATIRLRNSTVDKEHVKLLTVIKSLANKVANPVVLVIGDSLTQGSMDALAAKFVGSGVQPVFIGTRTNGGVTKGEGRGGWRAADFVYTITNTGHAPLPSGAESQAVSLGNDTRNPFIRVATGSDPVEDVKNGYIFDLDYYLTRFGFPKPDIVLINLGTNDIHNEGVTVGVANTIEAIRIMVAKIKVAAPNCKIGLALPANGNNSYYNPRWYGGYVPLFLDHHQKYAGRSSEGIYLIGSHAYLTDQFIFPSTTDSTNAQTGEKTETLSDGLHFTQLPIGASLYTEPLFQFIHAIS